MKIETFVLSAMETNCYFLINEDTKEMVIVDPAVCQNYLVSYVKTNGYIPKAILLTHAHFDHVMGIDEWVKEFGIPVYLHEEEAEILRNPALNLSQMFGVKYAYSDVKCLKDGDKLTLAGFTFHVIYTPGHTKGGCCYYMADERILISGDTLFYRSVGRSDFPTGDMRVLIQSVREKLFCLPDDVQVYPGHGQTTCIADEKTQLGT